MKQVRVHTSIFSHTPKAIYVVGGVMVEAGASDVGVGKVGKLNRGRFNIDVDSLRPAVNFHPVDNDLSQMIEMVFEFTKGA